jgi:Thioredoxin
MSEQRRERRDKEKSTNPVNWSKRVVYVLLIVAAFGAAYYLGNRQQHKYDGFAQCLKDRGVKMYGAWWCPHCQDQKSKFGAASFKLAPYVECGVQGDTSARTQVCKDEGIQHYPTWQFPPTGERVERVFELEELSDKTGCPLP